MATRPDDTPAKFAYPPLIYLACFAVGLAAEFFWPSDFLPAVVQYGVGGFVVAVSFAPMPFVMTRFKKAGTAFDSRGPTTTILREGPFRYSRNPAYLCMTLLYLGLGVLIDSSWILALSVVGFVLMNTMVVRREEVALDRQFGDAYRSYKSSVRRWI